MGVKGNIYMTLQGFKAIIRNVGIVRAGQQTNYAILQYAHRLEKGLCIRNPRKKWGYDKAERLLQLIRNESGSEDPDTKAIEIGKAVLAAYVAAKEKTEPGEIGLKELKSRIDESKIVLAGEIEDGGAVLLKEADMAVDYRAAWRLFMTRHSVRDFADTPVDVEKLEQAIALALCAPSACNRQATQVYVISGEDRVRAGSDNEYHADKYLIVTGNMRAFSLGELNDWIVSSAVFCGYLSLGLHAVGIGSCIFRKDTVKESKYNDSIRKICHIPKDEQIILEMAIGNYKSEFYVPVSCRRNVKDMIHYFD